MTITPILHILLYKEWRNKCLVIFKELKNRFWWKRLTFLLVSGVMWMLYLSVYMFLFVCLCGFVCLCLYASVFLCICLSMCLWIFEGVWVMFLCMFLCLYVCESVCVLVPVCFCVLVCLYVWLSVCVYVCISVCVYVCVATKFIGSVPRCGYVEGQFRNEWNDNLWWDESFK